MNWRHGFTQLALSLDQVINCVLGFGSLETWADETISSRCGRIDRYPYKAYRVVIDLLFRWQGPNHCLNAYHAELEHRQLPPEAR